MTIREIKMKEIIVYNTKGKKVETIELNEKVFNSKVNKAVLHQVVKMYLSNKRLAGGSTKTRAEVRGGGRKPWRQKGTGRARAGSLRSPIFRGGGVIFGPKPRDYSYKLPKKIKNTALISALNSKVQDNNLIIIDKIELEKPKTREFVDIFKNLKLDGIKVLVVIENFDEKVKKSSHNAKNISVKNVNDINAYNVLLNEKIVITKKSLELLNKRVLS